jgi:hypothetical protein
VSILAYQCELARQKLIQGLAEYVFNDHVSLYGQRFR